MKIPSEKAEEGGGKDIQLNTVPSLEGHQNIVDHQRKWFDDSIRGGLKWSIQVKRVLNETTTSGSKLVHLLETDAFGEILVINGKLQSAEKDEFICHECLVHPALLLHHDNPRTVFIMGGADGSTAREVLKHKSIEKVVMCTNDQEVVNFCRTHLRKNQEAFRSEKLHIVISEAIDELEKSEEKYDVIVGDLEDPLEEFYWLTLYNKSFYEEFIKPRLNPNGVFVTLAGPAGVLTHKGGFTPIYRTLKSCFQYVYPLNAHVPSYADTFAWVVASDRLSEVGLNLKALNLHPSNAVALDKIITEKIKGELRYLNGATIVASSIFNKTVQSALDRW